MRMNTSLGAARLLLVLLLLVLGQAFAYAQADGSQIAGAIATAAGHPLAGVVVSFTNGLPNQVTDAAGHYAVTVPRSLTASTVTPAKTGYTFVPASATVSVSNGSASANFVGAPVTRAETVATPTFSPTPSAIYTSTVAVSLACATAGATIYYTTDGNDPTTSSAVYTGPLTLTANTTVKAFAVKEGLGDSVIASADYAVRVAKPTFTPAGGTYTNSREVQIKCTTVGATIRYTTDGSEPTDTSTVYIGAFTLTVNTVVKAKAFFSGMTDSETASATFTLKASKPSFNPSPSTFANGISLTMTTTTPGVTIYYTTDGSTPTATSTAYTGAIALSTTTTIKAIVIKAGMTDSDIMSGTYTFKAGTPTLYPAPGTYGNPIEVTITSATTGATIRYTTDGTEPTADSTVYTAPIPLSAPTTLKAKAFKAGMVDSAVAGGAYVFQAATPTFAPGTGTYLSAVTVTLDTASDGATIHYTTDGTTPTVDSPMYTAPLELTQTTTLKAIAVLDGFTISNVGSATYTLKVAKPVFSPTGGSFSTPTAVTMTCATTGATIRYTTDGTEPTETSTAYTEPVTVNGVVTLKAKAFKDGLTISEITTANYTVRVAKPSISPGTSTVTSSVKVTLSCATDGATIRYTTNGADPTAASAAYSAPFTLYVSCTVKAKAFKDGMTESEVASAVYTVKVATPVVTPITGNYANPPTVTMTCTTSVATIRYTTDGSEPTETSTVYTAPFVQNSSATIIAKAFKTGLTTSESVTRIYTLKVATPVFLPVPGNISGPTPVTISCATTGSTIRYTTDGTDPTAESTVYTEAVTINATTTLKAKAFKDGMASSEIASGVYTLRVVKPTILPASGTFTSSVNITMSCATEGAAIRYTTDGSEPTVESTLYSAPFVLDTSRTVKAKAFKGGMSDSETASAGYIIKAATPIFAPGSGSYTDAQSVTITCATDGTTIRYTTDGTEPTEASTQYTGSITVGETTTLKAKAFKANISASNLATATYTIKVATPTFSPVPGPFSTPVSVSLACATAGATIRYTTNGTEPTVESTAYTTPIDLAATTTIKAKAFKTGVTASETATGTYTYQVATPTITPGSSTQTSFVKVTLACATDGAAIRYTTNGNDPTAASSLYAGQFTLYTSCTLKVKAFKAGMADSAVASATYTLKVANPTFSPSAGTYYDTQSVAISCTTTAVTIRYTTDGTEPTETSTQYTAPIAVGSNTTLKAKAFKTGLTASGVVTAAYLVKVATPSFTPAPGPFSTPISVSLACATTGATIRYTTDGSDPTAESTAYTAPIDIAATTTIKAKAFKTGVTDSETATGVYTYQVAKPTITPGSGTQVSFVKVTLACATDGAAIRYTTNGSDPTAASSLYAGQFTLYASCTLKVKAFKASMVDSEVASASYVVKAATPTFSPAAGTYNDTQTVAISCATTAVTIRYTTDGTEPTETSTPYTTPLTLNATTTVKAKAFKANVAASTVGSATYTIQVATPTFTPAAGPFSSPISVSIACATTGATIRYTTNGSDPTEASTAYSAPIAVSSTTTIKAKAFKGSVTASQIASATYTYQVDQPTITPGTGTYTTNVQVTLACATAGATIRYTTNGSDPTAASAAYTVPINLYTTCTLKAKAFKTGMADSTVASVTYTIKAAAPSFSPGTGSYTNPQTITMTCATSAVTMRYTTDGTEPTDTSTAYTAPITLSTTTTLKAKAFKTNVVASNVTTATYTIQVGAPTFTPTPGTYGQATQVSMSTTTAGASIRYTTNGTDPTAASTLYTAPITISADTTFKAKAFKAGMTDSAVSTGAYVIKVATPTFAPSDSSTYTNSVEVTISCATAGATIRYTTNGTDPTDTSTAYTAPITLSATTTMKAKAFKDGIPASEIGTATYTIKAAKPTFSPIAGTYDNTVLVTISTTTSSPTIRYTTDGTEPTAASTLYTAPLTIATATTLKAKVFKTGMTDSEVTTGAYQFKVATPTFVTAPSTFYNAITVALECETTGATIRYTTNGTEPTASSTAYSTPIAIAATTTLKAKAFKSGYTDSEIASGLYTMKVDTPNITPDAGIYNNTVTVSIACTTTGATIRYALGGSDPTSSSPAYTAPLTVATTTTVRAKAFKTGFTDSNVAVSTFTLQVATPSFTPAAGNYWSAQSVTIACDTPGATIRYTTNGTEPTASSTAYSAAISISTTTTLKAKAFKSGLLDSATATGTYTMKVAAPTFNPPAGTYTGTQSVTITCETTGATIRYTLDGSEPTSSSTVYSAAISVSASKTIKVKAFKSGLLDSDTVAAAYVIN